MIILQTLSLNPTFVWTPCDKYVDLYFDEKLNFSYYIKAKIYEVCKDIRVINKLHYVLPKNSLLTIYNDIYKIPFKRPYLDYDNIPYDQPKIQAISNKLENVQYNAALVLLQNQKLMASQNTSEVNTSFNPHPYNTRAYITTNITTCNCRTDTFNCSFFSIDFIVNGAS